MVLFRGKTCGDAEIVVSLQCVFHSIRFKVNKGLGHGGDPFFISFSFYFRIDTHSLL